MPDKLDRCVSDVKGQGKSEDSAWAICKSSTKETEDDICVECGEPRSNHGLFTDHDFQDDIEEFEDDDDEITISIKLGETTDQGPKPMGPVNVVESHNPLDIVGEEKEAVAIPGSLSNVSVGGNKLEECKPCQHFDAVSEALKSERKS